MPSGTAVSASVALCSVSPSRATDPDSATTTPWTTAVQASPARENHSARIPSAEAASAGSTLSALWCECGRSRCPIRPVMAFTMPGKPRCSTSTTAQPVLLRPARSYRSAAAELDRLDDQEQDRDDEVAAQHDHAQPGGGGPDHGLEQGQWRHPPVQPLLGR